MKKHLNFFQSSRNFYLYSLNKSAFLVKIIENIDYNLSDNDSCLHFIESSFFFFKINWNVTEIYGSKYMICVSL